MLRGISVFVMGKQPPTLFINAIHFTRLQIAIYQSFSHLFKFQFSAPAIPFSFVLLNVSFQFTNFWTVQLSYLHFFKVVQRSRLFYKLTNLGREDEEEKKRQNKKIQNSEKQKYVKERQTTLMHKQTTLNYLVLF